MTSSLRFALPSNQEWLQLRAGTNSLTATGGPVPQIELPLEARMLTDGIEGEIVRLTFEARIGSVLIGHGEIGTMTLWGTRECPATAVLTCPREALAIVMNPPPGRVAIQLSLGGLLRIRHQDVGNTARKFHEVEAPNTWHLLTLAANVENKLDLSFARSDWYEGVVAKLGSGGFLIAALHLPDPGTVPSWRPALGHLDQARKALVQGDAPAVFGLCRGVIEALPGNKTNIFDAMPEGPKQRYINTLTKNISTYIHSGRHVEAGTGEKIDGEYPVDIHDAAFVLDMTSVLLSHIARLVLPDSK